MQKTTMRGAVGLVVGLVGAMGFAVASPPGEQPSVQWAMSWEAAKAEAAARHVPIFVTFHKDG
jgi:hypothetical protein